MPLWLQKSVGPWTSYGGGGYWFNPGAGNRSYAYVGWQMQRHLSELATLGVVDTTQIEVSIAPGAQTDFSCLAFTNSSDSKTWHVTIPRSRIDIHRDLL